MVECQRCNTDKKKLIKFNFGDTSILICLDCAKEHKNEFLQKIGNDRKLHKAFLDAIKKLDH